MMNEVKLILDSGSTKTEWCLLKNNKPSIFTTQGMSPYFVDATGIEKIVTEEARPFIKKNQPGQVFFYGTGCKSVENRRMIKKVFQKLFPGAVITVDNDLSGAAKSLCGDEKGNACILGTGSNSCY